MSSSEPPSRIPPRQQPGETKAAREELSSKGKVEKVREVDPDEQARKQKFLKYYKSGTEEDDSKALTDQPTPFDLLSTPPNAKLKGIGGPLKEPPQPPGSFDDTTDAILPSPPYSPPPSVSPSMDMFDEEEDGGDEGLTGLPRSGEFYAFDLPDEPLQAKNFEEKPLAAPVGKEEGASAQRKKEKEILSQERQKILTQGKVSKEKEGDKKRDKKKVEQGPILAPPVSSPPGKKGAKEEKGRKTPLEEPPLKGPVSAAAAPVPSKDQVPPRQRAKEAKKGEETASPMEVMGSNIPMKSEEREGGEKRGKKEKEIEIASHSLPSIPAQVQPMAMAATTQAAPYLSPETAALFYQMVGTIYVMVAPPGVTRTEVVLNSLSYANSKFYGATITIEKYATAPDSFNIRLTGSQEAVALFKENIPNLLNAFQNGNFSFKVNRLNAEYTLERPLFRRKERGESKGEGDAAGGDLGERRK